MTLVERFIEFNGWSTARKTALLSGLGLVGHIFGTLNADYALSKLPWVDVRLHDLVLWPFAGVLAVCFLVSLTLARLGKEGSWTWALLVIPYGAFLAATLYLFGLTSSALLAWYPLVVLLVALWYGPRVGWFSMLYALGLMVPLVWLSARGTIPFAPALLDRSLDVQRSAAWIVFVLFVVMLVFVFCFVMVVLIHSAERLQETKLDESNHKMDEALHTLEQAHHKLAEAHEQLDHSARLIRRYVPSQLADKIIKGEHSETIRPERPKLTIFFSDVEGFTDASDRLDPEDLGELLNEYLAEMMMIAERYAATINQIVGDGIMIFFGAPQATSDKDHALRAVRMAQDMQKRMLELKDAWVKRGIEKPFRARIGINTGHASVGDYGSPGRKLYSAIGVQTNVAARIQSRCEPGKVLISHSTWALVKDDIACVDKGELQIRGVHYPVRVYEVSEAPLTTT